MAGISLSSYRGVWALGTISRETGRLRATHFAFPIVGGREPLWQVFTVYGRFVRYAADRAMVEAKYPTLVWRRWMVEWSAPVSEFRNHDIPERLDAAEQRTGKKPRR